MHLLLGKILLPVVFSTSASICKKENKEKKKEDEKEKLRRRSLRGISDLDNAASERGTR